MFCVLDRYISKTIFYNITMTLFILISLSGIIKFVEQLRKIGQAGYSTLGAGLFTLLNIPKDIEIFFPMAALLGALLGLGSLATHHELMVMQASGFRRIQLAVSVIKTTIPLILLTIVIGEWVAPIGKRIAYNYRNQMIYGDLMPPNQNGFWAKDDKNFIFIEQMSVNDELFGISIYYFNKEQRLQTVRHASFAKFKNGSWNLSQVNELNLNKVNQISKTQILNNEWKSNLTPDKLRAIALESDSLSISGLYTYINYLQQNGQEFKRYQLDMWSKIFSPCSVSIMILMALSFILGPLHAASITIQIITGISFGFLFYILDKTFGLLSLIYNITPVIGALLPSILFSIISIIILIWYK